MSTSWFQTLRARARPAARRAEQGLELRTVLQWQANVTWQDSQSASALIAALTPASDAVVRVDSLLVVKRGGAIFVNTLTLEQVQKLEHQPSLLTNPDGILEALGVHAGQVEPIDPDQELPARE